MKSSPSFKLCLLGAHAIRDPSGGIVMGRVAQRHRLGLLALLAAAHPHGQSRDRLMALLWPERDTDAARRLLNQSTYVIRQQLGEGAVLSRAEDLCLGSDVECDVVSFRRALAAGDPAAAVAVYGGPFMDGYFLPGSAEFEEWLERERTGLADRYGAALETLAEGAAAQHDRTTAVAWWRARALHDPTDTRIAMRLMEAMAAAGNRAGAIQHALAHDRLLRDGYGVTASAELHALADRLRGRTVVPGAAPAGVNDASPEATTAAANGTSPEAPPAGANGTSPTATPRGANDTSPEAGPGPASGVSPGAPSYGPGDVGPRAAAAGRPRRALPALPRRAVYYASAAIMVALLSLSRGGGIVPWDAPAAAGEAERPSIAVLPLEALGNGDADLALAAGMTEAIVERLIRARTMRVAGSVSVRSYLARGLDGRAVADSLRVRYVLDGSMLRVGQRLRVRVRLVDVRDGAARWAGTYERGMQDIFDMQDEVASAIAAELGVGLAAAGRPAGGARQTPSVAAYELYLRGTDPALLRSDSGVLAGLHHLRQAVELDPGFAAGWAALAKLHLRSMIGSGASGAARHFGLAEGAARRALELDGELAQAHATMGLVHLVAFDFEPAGRHLRRALELEPDRAPTHEWLATLFLWTGREAQALEHAGRALELEPLSPSAHAELATALSANGRCTEALEHLEHLSGIQPPLLRVPPLAAACHAAVGDWARAAAVLEPHTGRGGPPMLAQYGFMLARGGDREAARGVLATVLDQWREERAGAYEVALVLAGLGERDEALAWLDRALDERSLIPSPGYPVTLLLIGPLLADLRSDAAFEPLRRRLRLQG